MDYVRFPVGKDAEKALSDKAADDANRQSYITEFLTMASEEAHKYDVPLAADVFGTIIKSQEDANHVGQDYVTLVSNLDIICPMIYPSHYGPGEFGLDVPDAKPYETIYGALEGSKTALASIPEGEGAIVRPWLQAFTATWVDGHITYDGDAIRQQIQAVNDIGYEEWILWNAKSSYSSDGLEPSGKAGSSAVKYTPEGRIKLSVQGKISGGRLLLMITVSDTGIGIDEESIPYLFDSFTRVGEFQNQRIEGTGLGLTITKQLVEMMGGTITVESEPRKGTAFTVVIPQEIRTVEPCGTFSMGPNGDRRVVDRNEVFDVLGKILVVDDVAINLRVFSMLLNNTDITVDTAISASEALEKIKRNKYDIIFLDHLMPGMDGIQLKEIIMALPDNPNKDTPFIMQTANAVVGAKEQYEAFGFVDYIAKPIKEEELRKLLRRYMI